LALEKRTHVRRLEPRRSVKEWSRSCLTGSAGFLSIAGTDTCQWSFYEYPIATEIRSALSLAGDPARRCRASNVSGRIEWCSQAGWMRARGAASDAGRCGGSVASYMRSVGTTAEIVLNNRKGGRSGDRRAGGARPVASRCRCGCIDPNARDRRGMPDGRFAAIGDARPVDRSLRSQGGQDAISSLTGTALPRSDKAGDAA